MKDKRIEGYEVICFYPGNKERLRKTWRLYGYLRNNQGITIAANENAKSLNSGETAEIRPFKAATRPQKKDNLKKHNC